jgi:hypothetical protein
MVERDLQLCQNERAHIESHDTVCSVNVLNVVAVAVNLRPTVSRPVCLGVRSPSGTRYQFFFHLEISFRQLRVCNFVAPSLTRERVCNLLYNCFWAFTEQSLLGRSPAELTAIFYSVNLRPTVSRPVCPGVRRPSGTRYQFFFLLEISFRQVIL